MRKNPKISVIIPSYNRAFLLPRAIKSALTQTYCNFELIVVDDGSGDGTKEVVGNYQKKDNRVRYIRHKKNKGGSAARNTGIKGAKGTYIAFLDSDDEWFKTKLKEQLDLMEKSGLKPGAVYGGIKIIKPDGTTKSIYPKYRGNIFEELLERNIVGTTSGVLVKRICLEKAGGFDEDLPSRQDLDLWIRIAGEYSFDYCKEILTKHHKHANRISENLDLKIKGYNILYEKIEGDLKKFPRKEALYKYNTGLQYLKNKELIMARNCFRKSLARFPYPKTFITFALTFIGEKRYRSIESFLWFSNDYC